MDGIHDMGGMDGFGPIPIERDEPVFHAPWEGRVWALNAALGALGKWNIDAGRYALEQLDPALCLARDAQTGSLGASHKSQALACCLLLLLLHDGWLLRTNNPRIVEGDDIVQCLLPHNVG